ncbi:MAG: Calx-beta domain-containing protein [Verrucomicrobiota bacterium]|nr:Calx-beta domain-containing protein [Verrucomicrobiota bacterium]
MIHVNESVPNDWVALFDITPAEGEAEPFVDYDSDGVRIEFPIDSSLALVAVPILDDIETEPLEVFGMILSNPEAGYIADQATAIVGIIDDECSFELTVESVETAENGGPLSIQVSRIGGIVNPVLIEYDVTDDTAQNREDYLKGAGRIIFEAGQESSVIVVPIIDDIAMEGLETFELNLTAAIVDPDIALEGSATLGELISVKVTIIDDEMPGGVDPGFKLHGGANGPVFAILVDQDERILLGGDFTRVGGVNYGHVSRLHPDGYVDSSFNIGTGLDDIVWSLGVQLDRKPIPGGRYTVVDGNEVASASRLNADGVFDNTFNIDVGVDGEVFAVVVQSDGGIVIGGDFKKVSGQAANNIARLNSDGTLDTIFAVGAGADKPIRDISIQSDGKLVVVGEFGVLAGGGFAKIGRLNLDGTPDSEFSPGMGANGIVHAVGIQQDGGIIIGGEFTTVDGKETPYVARLQSNGILDEEWGGEAVGINGAVFDVGTLSDGKVIIGGEFTEISGYSRNSYARLHYNGELDRNFDPGEGANGPVFSVALQPDGNILLGGQFTRVGEYEQNNITRVFGGEQYALGRVEFRAPRIEYNEGVVTYELKVIRSGKVQEPVTVQYKTVDGTATQAEDYTAVSGDITFAQGGREATISIGLLDDELAEGTEYFTLELASEAVGIDLGGRISTEVVIIDNESSASFGQFELEVAESSGEVELVVNRFGGLDNESSVNYTVTGVAATADEDYDVAATGVLTFAAGSASASLIIGIVDDLDEEPSEQLAVTLSDPSEGLTLVGELTATVTLLDNDQPVPGLITFELGMIPPDSGWSSSGNKPWYAQTDQVYEGSYALRSGKIADAQESILMLERETGSGTGSFQVKISSEQDWDYLDFSLNGRLLGKWSGRVDWKKIEFPLEAGINKLQWRYKKDSSTFAGMDAAFIDNVFLPDVPIIEPDTKPTLAVAEIMEEGLKLILTGGVAKSYDIQFSTDLNSWSTIVNLTISETGTVEYIDTSSRQVFAKETWVEATGFYRAISSAQPDGD